MTWKALVPFGYTIVDVILGKLYGATSLTILRGEGFCGYRRLGSGLPRNR
jgi:hypothetical protein